MGLAEVYALLGVADDLLKSARSIEASLSNITGKPVDQIRAERDALSKDTHRIIQEERAKTPMP